MKNVKLLSLLLIFSILSFNFQSCTSPTTQEGSEATTDKANEQPETPTPETTTAAPTEITSTTATPSTESEEPTKGSSVEAKIQFVRDKYAAITSATDYRVDSTAIECERGFHRMERWSTQQGELRYLQEEACGEHGCTLTHHYFWDKELIFIFRQNYYYAGNSDYMQEHRTYFGGNEMIRCLEKDVSTTKGYEYLQQLVEKTPNKTVDCDPEKRTRDLQELIDLDLANARAFYCE